MTYKVTMALERTAGTAGVSLEAIRKRMTSRGEVNIDRFAVTNSGTINNIDSIGKDIRDRLVGVSTAHKFTAFAQGDKEFNVVLSRIEQLLYSEDDFKPTDYAYRRAISLIYEAYRILDGRFMRAAVAVDEDGSIVIYWKNSARNMHLTVPAEKDGILHIYHREGRDYGVEYHVTAATLAKWLQWYMRV